jgi:hypothetical protein
MHPSTTGRCGRNGGPIGPFCAGSNGSIRAHISSVRTGALDIHRESTLKHAQHVRHALAVSLIGKGKLPGPLGVLVNLLGPNLVDDAAKLGGEKLRQVNAEALAKNDSLTATLTRFRMDLDEGEAAQVLLRSPR